MRLTMLAVALLLLGSAAAPEAFGGERIQVLLITGDDVKAHNWKEMSEATREVLVKSDKFDVNVVEGLDVLAKKDELEKHAVVVFMLYNRKKVKLSDAAKENLVTYVKGGKGFMPLHLASASFKNWKEFCDMCGRYWVMGKSGHGPRSEFEVKIANKEHPITKGLEDFKTDDELYAKLLGETKINVLVEADSDWSKKTEPLAWTLDYGKGRVFSSAFGHDRKAIMTPSVQKLLVRGCEWAATGKVSE
jgi:type 1 glutamine amidotransferase